MAALSEEQQMRKQENTFYSKKTHSTVRKHILQ